MATREQIAKALGYPKDRLGNIYGPQHFDSDYLPSSEQVRRSHDPGWYEARMAKALASRLKRDAKLARLKRERDAMLALLPSLPTDPRNMN